MPTQNPLPYANIKANREMAMKRNIIHWFVPQVGIVKMFVNPNSINISSGKTLSEERTKGGHAIGYFGETLDTITISGTTGSSGIEGINVLNEIYRAEQYLFDQNAIAINSANNDNLTTSVTNYIGSQIGGGSGVAIAGLVSGISGAQDPMNTAMINPRNITTLADIAFGVEMYYSGVIYRGYFKSFQSTETAESFFITYNMTFMATQKRGYRLNHFPFQHSPTGPSQYDSDYSYNPSIGVK